MKSTRLDENMNQQIHNLLEESAGLPVEGNVAVLEPEDSEEIGIAANLEAQEDGEKNDTTGAPFDHENDTSARYISPDWFFTPGRKS